MVELGGCKSWRRAERRSPRVCRAPPPVDTYARAGMSIYSERGNSDKKSSDKSNAKDRIAAEKL